jgi:hypothetical protein
MIQSSQAADAATAVSATLAAASWLADLNAFLTTVASITAIVAGCAAALYHWEAWRQKRRERK